MRVSSSSVNELARVGPPFLRWSPESAEQLEAAIKAQCHEPLVIRRIDGNAARDLNGLGRELGKAFGQPIAGNQDALEDVMRDVHCHGGEPAPTVYVVENAAAILRDLPAGIAMWGTKAEGWARAWAQPVKEGETWDHDPIPLHFIHSVEVLPRNAPNMNRFEIGKP